MKSTRPLDTDGIRLKDPIVTKLFCEESVDYWDSALAFLIRRDH